MSEELSREEKVKGQWAEVLRSGKKLRPVGGRPFWVVTGITTGIAVFFWGLFSLSYFLSTNSVSLPLIPTSEELSGIWRWVGLGFIFSAAFNWDYWLFTSVQFADGRLQLKRRKGKLLDIELSKLSALAVEEMDGREPFIIALLFWYSVTGRPEDLRWHNCPCGLWQPGLAARIKDEILARTDLGDSEPIITPSRMKSLKKRSCLIWRKPGDSFDLPPVPWTGGGI